MEYPYLQQVLDIIYATRRYNYRFDQIPFNGEYPVYFRQHKEFLMDNRRHETITCEIYDNDPLINDMSVMAITGTGLGLDYSGQWNTVSHRTSYGSFKGERTANGDYPDIIRKSAHDFPDHGKSMQD